MTKTVAYKNTTHVQYVSTGTYRKIIFIKTFERDDNFVKICVLFLPTRFAFSPSPLTFSVVFGFLPDDTTDLSWT